MMGMSWYNTPNAGTSCNVPATAMFESASKAHGATILKTITLCRGSGKQQSNLCHSSRSERCEVGFVCRGYRWSQEAWASMRKWHNSLLNTVSSPLQREEKLTRQDLFRNMDFNTYAGSEGVRIDVKVETIDRSPGAKQDGTRRILWLSTTFEINNLL